MMLWKVQSARNQLADALLRAAGRDGCNDVEKLETAAIRSMAQLLQVTTALKPKAVVIDLLPSCLCRDGRTGRSIKEPPEFSGGCQAPGRCKRSVRWPLV